MPSGFGGRAESEVSMGHIFFQCMPGTIATLGGRAGVGRVRTRARLLLKFNGSRCSIEGRLGLEELKQGL